MAKVRRLFAGSLVLLIASGSAAVASAEELSTKARNPIEEIVVTARKREERLLDVPTAITAFGSEDISRYKLNVIDDLADFTPGLLVAENSVSSGGSIYLRGIGSGGDNYLGDPGVSINVDGMQIGSMNIRKTAQIDLAQIEVLRGPQALFYGKNSPGGVVALKTADPTQQREVEMTASYEVESGDAYYQALYSGPISENAGLRLVAQYSDLGGYFNLKSVPANGDPLIIPPHVNHWASGEEYFVRGTLVAEPSERFRVKAKASYSESNLEGGTITAYQRISCPLGAPQRQPDFPCKADKDTYLGGAPIDAIQLIDGAPSTNGLGLREDKQFLGILELNYDLTPEIVMTSLTGYYDFSEVNAHNPSVGPRVTAIVPFVPFDQEQWTQELRLTSDWEKPINFMLGLFYESKDTEASQGAVILAFPPAPFATGIETSQEDQHAFSAFGQLMWNVTERLEVSGGLRYSYEEKDLEFFYNDTDVTSNLADDRISFDNLSPELTVSYELAEDVMMFISYKDGFKSGGFDGGFTNGAILTPGFENTFKEEQVSGFEGGIKSILNQSLALNVTLYRYDYEDLQVSNFDADTITFKVRNAAEATIQGIEADINWSSPIEGLSLLGSIAYNDAEFDDFISPCYTGQTPASGCSLTPNPSSGAFLEQDLSGHKLHNAPKIVATAGIKYFRTFGNGLSLDLVMNAFYSDEYSANSTQSPQDIQDDYVKLNAFIRLLGPSDRWQVALAGRNLTNEYTFSRSGPVTFTGGGTGTDAGFPADRSGVVSHGREVFLDFTYRLQFAQ